MTLDYVVTEMRKSKSTGVKCFMCLFKEQSGRACVDKELAVLSTINGLEDKINRITNEFNKEYKGSELIFVGVYRILDMKLKSSFTL